MPPKLKGSWLLFWTAWFLHKEGGFQLNWICGLLFSFFLQKAAIKEATTTTKKDDLVELPLDAAVGAAGGRGAVLVRVAAVELAVDDDSVRGAVDVDKTAVTGVLRAPRLRDQL